MKVLETTVAVPARLQSKWDPDRLRPAEAGIHGEQILHRITTHLLALRNIFPTFATVFCRASVKKPGDVASMAGTTDRKRTFDYEIHVH